MNWSESIKAAIDYIEDNLTNDITINDISKKCYISPYYFQKGFSYEDYTVEVSNSRNDKPWL